MVAAGITRRFRFLLTVSLTLMACAQAGSPETLTPALDKAVGSIEIINDAALSLIDPGAVIRIRANGYKWTEGPLWIEDGGYLLFSDIPNNVIDRYDPETGARLYLENSGATGLHPDDSSQGSNGLLLDGKGRLVLFQQGDRRVAVMEAPLTDPKAQFISLAEDYRGKRLNSPNDGVFHSDGSLYFTDPPYGLEKGLDDPGKELSFQGIFRLNSGGELTLLDDSVSFPNGIALSVDESTLYVAVSDDKQPQWLAYDLQADGSVANKRVFYDASALIGVDGEHGLPDGMAVHTSGMIFATGPGGVWLFTPEGKVLAKIRTGKATANCSLSADEKVLFMTAHDTLMTVPLK